MEHIVESELLAHGIRSLSNEEIRKVWGDTHSQIVWMEQGQIIIDGIDRFLEFRKKLFDIPVRPGTAAPREAALIAGMTGKTRRVTYYNLDIYAEDKADAVLTASGTMSVCAREGIDAAVTAGISGFFPEMLYGSEEVLVTKGDGPPDIAALTALSVTLVSSGLKDMFDHKGTFRFLEQHGVRSIGVNRDCYTGYLFAGDQAALSRSGEPAASDHSVLIVNEINEEKRIQDRKILDQAIEYGLEAERQGGYYMPVVNDRVDQLTDGQSARIQLQALVDNALLAAELTSD